ncbi:hypothetical protein B0O99DRAFT_530302, partial [Bisporella sp. PMI_857]
IFITLLECFKYLQFNYNVILINNTYRTNRFNMLLFNVIRVDRSSKTFFIEFAFLFDETESVYK